MRPSPPTTVAELQWGESRSGAFGTARGVAGSYFNLSVVGPAALCGQPLVLAVLQAVNPDLAPDCQVGEEERAGRAGVASLSFIES